MTKRLRSLAGGRLRIWQLSHGREAVRAMQLVALVGLFLTASTMDYHDQLAAAEAAREQVAEQLRQERLAHGLPRTTFIVDAATVSDARARLNEIAGDLDTWRLKNRGVKGGVR